MVRGEERGKRPPNRGAGEWEWGEQKWRERKKEEERGEMEWESTMRRRGIRVGKGVCTESNQQERDTVGRKRKGGGRMRGWVSACVLVVYECVCALVVKTRDETHLDLGIRADALVSTTTLKTWGLWWARWPCRPRRGGHPGVRDHRHSNTLKHACMHSYTHTCTHSHSFPYTCLQKTVKLGEMSTFLVFGVHVSSIRFFVDYRVFEL